MKLINKLAKDWEDECGDRGGSLGQMSLAGKSFMAGFRKARELAAKDMDRCPVQMGWAIRVIGEEEVSGDGCGAV